VSDNSKPQNIYDNPVFFAGYKALRQNDTGLNGAMEVPALRRLLPPLAGKSVLDLGCGFGHFARQARAAGATRVTALDVSRNMLDEAARLTADSAITYVHCSIEEYTPRPHSFDLVASSLSLHYVANYPAVAMRVFNALQPKGWFVFSVEHPICTANPAGWIRDGDGRALHWPLNNYQQEGWRATTWFVEGVKKYHRTVASYVNGLTGAGFRIEHLVEPMPSAEALAVRPALAIETRRPAFLLLAASRS
jgi:2-polyprenyl-3-methyl-5-hydroxy-6-metoxy-1,4-benzoquinol methylase